ncbi:hypothetical protein CHCC14431_0303 [Bacillus licheniformis]|nr:hypothetical protein CHCC14431_0303 [Bacillus licheniformis]
MQLEVRLAPVFDQVQSLPRHLHPAVFPALHQFEEQLRKQ